jgi:hypothetical protein
MGTVSASVESMAGNEIYSRLQDDQEFSPDIRDNFKLHPHNLILR